MSAPRTTPAADPATQPAAIRYFGIPTAMAGQVRATMAAPRYGHPAHRETATGYGPCRHCLRTFAVGRDARILFTWDPFQDLEDLPLPGPVFIHAEPCPRYPEDGGFPEDLRPHPLTLNAYGSGRRLVSQVHAAAGEGESQLAQLLADDQIAYVHVRDTAAGCYDFRAERGSTLPDGAAR